MVHHHNFALNVLRGNFSTNTVFFRPGAIAPFNWVKECVLALVPEKNSFRQKILLGLNFYGHYYKGDGMGGMYLFLGF